MAAVIALLGLLLMASMAIPNMHPGSLLSLTVHISTVVLLGTFPSVSAQNYKLQSSFTGADFFNEAFQLYTGYDPTFGFVNYVDLPTAEQFNLVNLTEVSNSGIARWGVDTTEVLDPHANLGRKSLRLQSVETWTHGLFVIDLAHMPSNQCGVWPAFWTLGPGTWPYSGEIDIIELTNNVPDNLMSLHSSSSPNCTVAGVNQTGTLLSNDCAFADSYTGCAVSATQPYNSGTAFNAAGGGVFAMLWTSSGIQIWMWTRQDIPPSLSHGAPRSAIPNISQFGVPAANFEGSCDWDEHFHDHQLIFDTTFCGSNAGNTWQIDGCPMFGQDQSWQSCDDFVALNPNAFTETYWEVNYLNVYQLDHAAPTSQLPASTPRISSIPVVSTSPLVSLTSAALGRSSTLSSPVANPGAAQARSLTSFAGATWPASWVVPAPWTTPTPAPALKADLVTSELRGDVVSPDPQAGHIESSEASLIVSRQTPTSHPMLEGRAHDDAPETGFADWGPGGDPAQSCTAGALSCSTGGDSDEVVTDANNSTMDETVPKAQPSDLKMSSSTLHVEQEKRIETLTVMPTSSSSTACHVALDVPCTVSLPGMGTRPTTLFFTGTDGLPITAPDATVTATSTTTAKSGAKSYRAVSVSITAMAVAVAAAFLGDMLL